MTKIDHFTNDKYISLNVKGILKTYFSAVQETHETLGCIALSSRSPDVRANYWIQYALGYKFCCKLDYIQVFILITMIRIRLLLLVQNIIFCEHSLSCSVKHILTSLHRATTPC